MRHCKDCNKILAGHNNPQRCGSCAQKLNKLGTHHTKETKQKMRIAKIEQVHPNYIDGRSLKKYSCMDCSKEITRIGGIYGSGLCKSCSPNVRNLSKLTRQKQSLSHGGTGIPYELTEYGTGFNNVIKEQIRFRDGYKCQICGKPEIECIRKLDVHHIDYDKKNNKINNLISLCHLCHLKTNYCRDYWENYLIKKDKNES